MKRIVLGVGILLVVAIIFFAIFSQSNNVKSANSSSDSSSIIWSTDLNTALQQAKTSNKMVFIDFYTDWCGYCRQMDQNTYTDLHVQERLAQSYIAVKVNSDQNPDLSTKYDIVGLPTMVILDSDGQEIKRISGYQSADQLLSQL